MYEITITRDSNYLCKYLCEGRLQDGTERWECDTLDEAVESLISFAKLLNGSTITRKSITLNRWMTVASEHNVPHEEGVLTPAEDRLIWDTVWAFSNDMKPPEFHRALSAYLYARRQDGVTMDEAVAFTGYAIEYKMVGRRGILSSWKKWLESNVRKAFLGHLVTNTGDTFSGETVSYTSSRSLALLRTFNNVGRQMMEMVAWSLRMAHGAPYTAVADYLDDSIARTQHQMLG